MWIICWPGATIQLRCSTSTFLILLGVILISIPYQDSSTLAYVVGERRFQSPPSAFVVSVGGTLCRHSIPAYAFCRSSAPVPACQPERVSELLAKSRKSTSSTLRGRQIQSFRHQICHPTGRLRLIDSDGTEERLCSDSAPLALLCALWLDASWISV